MAVDTNKVNAIIKSINDEGLSVSIPSIEERNKILGILTHTEFLKPATTHELWLAKDRMLNHPMLVIKKGNSIAAFVNFNLRNSLFDHKGYIRSVYVAPDFRGKGLSKKIIHLAELFLKKPYWLLIDSLNNKMLDNVKKLGYSIFKSFGDKVLVEKR